MHLLTLIQLSTLNDVGCIFFRRRSSTKKPNSCLAGWLMLSDSYITGDLSQTKSHSSYNKWRSTRYSEITDVITFIRLIFNLSFLLASLFFSEIALNILMCVQKFERQHLIFWCIYRNSRNHCYGRKQTCERRLILVRTSWSDVILIQSLSWSNGFLWSVHAGKR